MQLGHAGVDAFGAGQEPVAFFRRKAEFLGQQAGDHAALFGRECIVAVRRLHQQHRRSQLAVWCGARRFAGGDEVENLP